MEDFTADDCLLLARVSSRTLLRSCSVCGAWSRRVHSRYERKISDRPVAGRSTVILLTVRRFFCDNAECHRRTFVEQVDGISERYRQASTGLRQLLHAIAAEFGGRPAARLCRKIAAPAGGMRLLELLQAPPVPQRPRRILGVDEFAFRKRCNGSDMPAARRRPARRRAAARTSHPRPTGSARPPSGKRPRHHPMKSSSITVARPVA
ncbi:transposase family protein [Streptomyces sp. NPDC001020]